jgi:Domain of unknown function (DUF4279)
MENENDGWIVGGDIDSVSVSLRVAAPDLDPSAITRRFGVEPTFSARRGDKRPSKTGTITQNVGIWVLDLANSPEWELGDAIAAVLDRLPSDLTIWNEIAESGEIDVFCGLHLEDWNRGVDLSASLLARLGERKISLSLDIYCDGSDDADA